MLSSAISMAAGGNNIRRNQSQQNNITRSASQTLTEYRFNYLSPSSPTLTHPMRNFFGNLLHLTPNRYISPLNTLPNRSKISSSLSTTIPSDRSSRMKLAHQSMVSSFSIRSLNIQSQNEIRVNLLSYSFFFL